MSFFKPLRGQSGFGLVQVMLAAGLIGGLSVAVMKLSNMAMNATKVVEGRYSSIQFNEQVVMMLSKTAGCGNTFTPPVGDVNTNTEITQLIDSNGTVRFSTGDRVMNTWQIAGMNLSAWTEDSSNPGTGEAMLTITLNRTGGVKLGQSTIEKAIPVFIRATPGNLIDSCVAVSTASGGNSGTLWTSNVTGAGEYIYYNGSPIGNVGIGPNTEPGAPLEISKNGSLTSDADSYKTVLLGNGHSIMWDMNDSDVDFIGIGQRPNITDFPQQHFSIFSDISGTFSSLFDIDLQGNLRVGSSNKLASNAYKWNVLLGRSSDITGALSNNNYIMGFNNDVDNGSSNIILGHMNDANSGAGGNLIFGTGNQVNASQGVTIGSMNIVNSGGELGLRAWQCGDRLARDGIGDWCDCWESAIGGKVSRWI